MSTFQILVVDDDKSIVKLLRGYLKQAGYTVLAAYDGEAAIHVLRRERPDLLILDIMLPGRDGWEITQIIRSDPHLVSTPIIMLTARVEGSDKIMGLELGADDYITKPFNGGEVVARIQALLRRVQLDTRAMPEIVRLGKLMLDVGSRDLTVAGKPIQLTPTEFELLHILIQSPRYTFTREELIESSMGLGYKGMDRTLDTHILNLRRKIEDNPKKPQMLQTVYGIGYRLVEAQDSRAQDHE